MSRVATRSLGNRRKQSWCQNRTSDNRSREEREKQDGRELLGCWLWNWRVGRGMQVTPKIGKSTDSGWDSLLHFSFLWGDTSLCWEEFIVLDYDINGIPTLYTDYARPLSTVLWKSSRGLQCTRHQAMMWATGNPQSPTRLCLVGQGMPPQAKRETFIIRYRIIVSSV